MDFVPLLQDLPSPKWPTGNIFVQLRDNFDISTWLLIGAAIQSLLVVAVGRLAALPAALILVYKVCDAYAMKTGLRRNTYMDGVIETKFSAQFPDTNGAYGNRPAKKEVCVFLVGAKCNSPLGILEPKLRELGRYWAQMVKELEANPEPFGFLGATSWNGAERSSSNTKMLIMYFRSAAGAHDYALSPLHREGWNWWNREVADTKCFSIFHELYQVPSGNWETIYANMQPNLAASTMHKVTGKDGTQSWASPIVDARKGLLKTSRGRMSRSQGKENDSFQEGDPYGDAAFTKI